MSTQPDPGERLLLAVVLHNGLRRLLQQNLPVAETCPL